MFILYNIYLEILVCIIKWEIERSGIILEERVKLFMIIGNMVVY